MKVCNHIKAQKRSWSSLILCKACFTSKTRYWLPLVKSLASFQSLNTFPSLLCHILPSQTHTHHLLWCAWSCKLVNNASIFALKFKRMSCELTTIVRHHAIDASSSLIFDKFLELFEPFSRLYLVSEKVDPTHPRKVIYECEKVLTSI